MKNILVFTPIVLSALLLAAHFKKAGLTPFIIFALLMPVILFYKRAWVARLVQIVFVLGTIEWIRTTLIIIGERQSNGESWIRVAIILGAVAVFTFCSGMIFSWSCSLRKIYGLDKSRYQK